MTREEKREYQKKYREANKEKKAASDKKYREANKEKLSAKKKAYYQANKERFSLYHKKKYEENREERLAKVKEYNQHNKESKRIYDRELRESRKNGYIVYLLPEENYVGQTNSFIQRMSQHKTSRNIDNAKVLARFKTREEAKEYEAQMHSLGYNGYYNGR